MLLNLNSALITVYETKSLLNLFGENSLNSIELFSIYFADVLLLLNIIGIIIMVGSNLKNSHQKLITSLINIINNVLKIVIILLTYSIYILIKQNINTPNFKESGFELFSSTYSFTVSTQLTKLIIILISLFLLIIFTSTKQKSIELPVLFGVLIAFSFVLISTTNFVVLLLALEGFSLILYIMTTVEHVHGGVTAIVKYFAFGTLGSILLFWGVVHIYIAFPSMSYNVLNLILNSTNNLNANLEFALTIIILGFLIKLGSAPLHQWVADVYAGSSTFVTAVFATLVKSILFLLFIKIIILINNNIIDSFIIASLIIGCYYTLKQTEIKRFLAYSSVVHVAFLLMGDLAASLVYLATYVISGLLFFSVLSTVTVNNKELIYLNDLKYVRQITYAPIMVLVVSLASSAGLPPFAGFYGKFVVWVSLFEDIYLFNNLWTYIILGLSIAISLITIFYYMRIIAYLFVSDDNQYIIENNSPQITTLSMTQLIFMLLVTLWTIFHSEIVKLFNYIIIFI